MKIEEKLANAGLSAEQYEAALKDICDKVEGLNDMDWIEIRDKYNLDCHPDSLKKSSHTCFGGPFVKAYLEDKFSKTKHITSAEETLEQIRKEKIKLQTLNAERARIDRQAARQELFFENIGKACEALPLPDFYPIQDNYNLDDEMHYILTLADIHYGATFKSEHNEYSREICKQRLERLCGDVINFVQEHQLSEISIVELGDSIQGILRLSDLRINDTDIVRCIVEISRLLAEFVNQISAYCNVNYYHVPSANHTQARLLNAKPSELASEDYEYIIGNYIKDLLRNNERVSVTLADEGKQYVQIQLPYQNIYAMHGHQFQGTSGSHKDFMSWIGQPVDTLILGHFHGGLEKTAGERINDQDLLVASSMVGSDPFSDRLMRGSKAAAKIYGFSDEYGYTESYKFILN